MNALAVSNDEFSAVGYEPDAIIDGLTASLSKADKNAALAARRTSHVYDKFDVDDVCEALINAKSFVDIARDYGCGCYTLLSWVERDPLRSARVRDARTTTAKLWDEQAIADLTAAGDAFSLAKARELAHHYRWRASKIAPKEYGDKLDLTVTSQATLPALDLSALSAEEIQVFERLLAKAQAPTIQAAAIDITPVDVTALTSRDTKA